MTKENTPIYNFKNSYPIRYALPYDRKGDKYSRFRRAGTDYEGFHKALASSNKHGLPLLELHSAFDMPIVAADFDKLPDRFKSFDDFDKYLVEKYSHLGLVTRTPSGKCKVLFQLELPRGSWLEDVDFPATLKSLLDPMDFELIDLVSTALSKAYLTPIMFEQFKTWNPIYHLAVLGEQIVKMNKEMAEYSFGDLTKWFDEMPAQEKYIYELILKQLLKDMPRSNMAIRNHLAIFLTRYRKNMLYGFRINHEVMATLLGCQRKTAGKILKTLRKLGLIKKIGNHSVGRQAARWICDGEYKHIISMFEDTETSTELTSSNLEEINLDIPIQDGMANQQYLSLCRQLKGTELSDSEIVDILMTKDRLRPTKKWRPINYFTYMVENYSSKNS